jgi:hypothetical protein
VKTAKAGHRDCKAIFTFLQEQILENSADLLVPEVLFLTQNGSKPIQAGSHLGIKVLTEKRQEFPADSVAEIFGIQVGMIPYVFKARLFQKLQYLCPG